MAPEYSAVEWAGCTFTEVHRLSGVILEEDKLCVERVYHGMQAILAAPGPVSHLECGNHGSARWVVGRVLS